ncbi:hypothetical protein KY359_04315 [Candidatus Woesearchaeota archaeon]|nr:hypothetical protein [Candidatus Woesearchaeota archaeon]
MKYGHSYVAIILILLMLAAGCAITKDTYTLSSKPVKSTQTEREESTEPAAPEPEEPAEEKTYTPTKKDVTTTPEPEPVPEPEPQMTFEQEEQKAIAAAEDFVKSMDSFKSQHGRNLKVVNTIKTGCEGCWIVYMSFTRDLQYYPDKIEYVKINVKLKNWKMESYTFE